MSKQKPEGKRLGGELRAIKVSVNAKVFHKDTLFFRNGMADATAPDGREYEVCSNINGDSILVRRTKPDGGPWLSISSYSLVEAYVDSLEKEKEVQ